MPPVSCLVGTGEHLSGPKQQRSLVADSRTTFCAMPSAAARMHPELAHLRSLVLLRKCLVLSRALYIMYVTDNYL